jgi:signal transduction histidine kinase
MAIRHIYISFLLLFSFAAAGQQKPHFLIQQYGTEDGLPSNGIKGLQWDKNTGFLWIATEAGMVRYNGMAFKTYTSEDNPQITNERILFLIRNNAGVIYTADNTGNIFSVKKNNLAFAFKKTIAGNAYSNSITLATSDIFYNRNHKITNGPFAVQFDKIIPVADTAAYILHHGFLYFFSISMETAVLLSHIPQKINAGFIANGEVYFNDNQATVWKLHQPTMELIKADLIFENEVLKPAAAKNIFIWENGIEFPIILNGKKAWKIEAVNGRLTAKLVADNIPQDVLIRYAQYDDVNHTLFIGTDSKGIIIIKENKVVPMIKERTNPKERTSYYSQVELSDGNIMTNEGHIIGINNPEKNVPPLKGLFSISTYMMGDSVFWFIQPNLPLKISCLHSYNFRTKKLTAYPKIVENFSQLVITAASGNLYMANEYGIYKMEGDSSKAVYVYPQVNKQRTNFAIKEISPGTLVIATCNALLRYNILNNKLDTLYAPGNYCVRSIWIYKDYIFFGTYGNGFFISKNGVVKQLPLDKNRYLLFTHCFIDDGNGFCWISSNRGLFKVNIEEMINAFETNASQVYYHYFGRNDGMDMTEMNGGCAPCALLLRNKTISFPTMEGLLWVNPATAKPVLPAGEIFIDEILLDNKRITIEQLQQQSLSAIQHDMQIRLGFSAWCNKENIYLEYQLNDNSKWIPVNIDNTAVIELNNLSGGSYKLRIRKLNGFGFNNYSYKEISFNIAITWYRKWWVWLFGLLIIAGLLVLYFKYRTRQLKLRQKKLETQVAEKTKELLQQNQLLEKSDSIKTRLISIISHDIITPLKFLTVAGKNLVEKRKVMSEELQQETIQEITNTSQELQLLSTNILNWIKYQNENRRLAKETFNLHELVRQVLSLLQSLAKQKKLLIENNVSETLEVHQYYEPLKILIYNLLTNSIHFTEKGTISVAATEADNTITVSVKDEGIGMTKEQIQRILADEVVITSANVDNKKGHGLGYLIIKDLIKTMNARLAIESKKNEGTTVSIVIPSTH